MDFLGLIGSVAGAIDSQVNAVVVWITGQLEILFGDISAVNGLFGNLTDYLRKTLSSLWTWLNQLWRWLQDTILVKIRDLIEKMHDKLAKIFKPLTDLITQYEQMLRDLWQRYVKPLYDFIQRLRRVLVVFRLLGFKWAKELDAYLVSLETKLTKAFMAVYGNLNILADWINYIVDPFGVFQPSVLLGSISQAVGAIIGMVYGKMNDPGFTAPAGSYSTPAGYWTANAIKNRTAARSDGQPVPEDTSIRLSLLSTARALGYPQ